MPIYRKAFRVAVWHSHSNCTTWPTRNYFKSENIQGETCTECTALHALPRTCPVFVNQKLCELELLRNSDGFYDCELGHRTRVIE